MCSFKRKYSNLASYRVNGDIDYRSFKYVQNKYEYCSHIFLKRKQVGNTTESMYEMGLKMMTYICSTIDESISTYIHNMKLKYELL